MGQPRWPSIGAAIRQWTSLHDWQPSPERGPAQTQGQSDPLPWRIGPGRPSANHRLRGLVTPARRGRGVKSISNAEVRSPAEHHAAMTWAQRLKRVFNIDIEICGRCGGSVRVIADASDRCIEDQDIIDRILAHLRDKERAYTASPLLAPPSRAPPETLPLFAESESTTTRPSQLGRH